MIASDMIIQCFAILQNFLTVGTLKSSGLKMFRFNMKLNVGFNHCIVSTSEANPTGQSIVSVD